MRQAIVTIAAVFWLVATPLICLAEDSPPKLDCGPGFEGIRAAVLQMPGAASREAAGFEIVAFENPDTWKVEYGFTSPAHPAHPAVVMRTLIKQVTNVWTSQSKGCGFGNPSAFATLMADAKVRDSELTNASRAEVERAKSNSPLGGTP